MARTRATTEERNKRLNILVSDSELQTLKDSAKYYGLSVSDYVRLKMLDNLSGKSLTKEAGEK